MSDQPLHDLSNVSAPPPPPVGLHAAQLRDLARSPGCVCGGVGCRWCSFEYLAAEFAVVQESAHRVATNRSLALLSTKHLQRSAVQAAQRSGLVTLGATVLVALLLGVVAPLIIAAGTALAVVRAMQAYVDAGGERDGRTYWLVAWLPLAMCGFIYLTGGDLVAPGAWVTIDPDAIAASWTAHSRQLWLTTVVTSLGVVGGFAWVLANADR